MGFSDIFYFFFARGRGRVTPVRQRGGGSVFIENPRGGGSPKRGGGAGRGWEGVCGEFGGGGAKYFFSGPKFLPSRASR